MMQLVVKVKQQQNDDSVALQCCGELLTENLQRGVMECNVCGTRYPLSDVRALIVQGQRALNDLKLALT